MQITNFDDMKFILCANIYLMRVDVFANPRVGGDLSRKKKMANGGGCVTFRVYATVWKNTSIFSVSALVTVVNR